MLYDEYELKSGRYGDYFVRISDGKIASWPRIKAKAEDASKEFIELLFELPKLLYKDEESNEIVLKSGPYGFYASYKGKNSRVSDPLSFKAESLLEGGEENKTFSVDGKSAEIARGRYGYYIKYDGKNYPLPSAYKKDVSGLSAEDVEKAIKSDNAKAPSESERVFTVSGESVSLINGKYGYYLKRGKDNIALPQDIKNDISTLTEEKVQEIVSSYVPKAKKSYSKKR